MAHAFVRVMLENRTHYHLTFATPRLESKAELLPAAEEARGLVDDALQQLAARGQLATTDLEAAFQSIWVLLHGFIDLQIARPDYAWAPELLELMLDTWERGMVRARES